MQLKGSLRQRGLMCDVIKRYTNRLPPTLQYYYQQLQKYHGRNNRPFFKK